MEVAVGVFRVLNDRLDLAWRIIDTEDCLTVTLLRRFSKNVSSSTQFLIISSSSVRLINIVSAFLAIGA